MKIKKNGSKTDISYDAMIKSKKLDMFISENEED